MPVADTLRAHLESSLNERLSSTLLLRERQAPLTVPIGVPALDELTGGLPRGALSEIAGPPSSGRTGVMLAALAGATCRQEICALVDATDSFDPASAERAGVDLSRLLWVRCSEQEGRPQENVPGCTKRASFAFSTAMEQVLKVTDLLLQGGGFGMVVLDLGDIPSESLRRVPLTSWFRFRRAVEPTATVLLLLEQEAWAKTCASLVLQLRSEEVCTQDSAQSAALHDLARMTALHDANPTPAVRDSVRGWRVHRSATERGVPFHAGGIFVQGHGEEPQIQLPENPAVSHATLLRGMNFRAEVVRSWTQRRPAHSAGVSFGLRAAM